MGSRRSSGAETTRARAELLRTEFCGKVASNEVSLVADARERAAVQELDVRPGGDGLVVENAVYAAGLRARLSAGSLRRNIAACAAVPTSSPLGSDARQGRFLLLEGLPHDGVGDELVITGTAVGATQRRRRAYALVGATFVVVGTRTAGGGALDVDMARLLAVAAERVAQAGAA